MVRQINRGSSCSYASDDENEVIRAEHEKNDSIKSYVKNVSLPRAYSVWGDPRAPAAATTAECISYPPFQHPTETTSFTPAVPATNTMPLNFSRYNEFPVTSDRISVNSTYEDHNGITNIGLAPGHLPDNAHAKHPQISAECSEVATASASDKSDKDLGTAEVSINEKTPRRSSDGETSADNENDPASRHARFKAKMRTWKSTWGKRKRNTEPVSPSVLDSVDIKTRSADITVYGANPTADCATSEINDASIRIEVIETGDYPGLSAGQVSNCAMYNSGNPDTSTGSTATVDSAATVCTSNLFSAEVIDDSPSDLSSAGVSDRTAQNMPMKRVKGARRQYIKQLFKKTTKSGIRASQYDQEQYIVDRG